MGLCPRAAVLVAGTVGRPAAGTQEALRKKLLLPIISQQPEMLEPAVSWTETASQHNLRYSRPDPAGCLLREGFSHFMMWQWDREDPLET